MSVACCVYGFTQSGSQVQSPYSVYVRLINMFISSLILEKLRKVLNKVVSKLFVLFKRLALRE